MNLREEELLAKGWSQEEIEEAKNIFERAKQKNHKHNKFFEQLSYWLFFILVIFGGIASSWIMEPLLFVLSTTGAIVTSASFGILFGGLLSFIVKDIERVEKHHHILIVIFVITSAVGTSIYFAKRLHNIIQKVPELIMHNPYTIGLSFSIATIFVYGTFLLYRWKKYGSL